MHKKIKLSLISQVMAVFWIPGGRADNFPYPCKDGQILYYMVTSDTTAEIPTETFENTKTDTGSLKVKKIVR